jgi:putative phage-type endonuclease
MIYQTLLDRCPHISTIGMSNDEWLDKRREGIGGSDAGAIMGMSAYGSPLTVYLQKKNLVLKGETSRAAHRGKILEPMIRVETVKDFPELEIDTTPVMFFAPESLIMLANIDGVILAKAPVEIRGQSIEGLGGHEIKSAKTNFGWEEDEIPDAYYCQVQHYMMVTGLPWFLVSVYILDDESLCHYVIRRNEDFIARLDEAERDFWENYLDKDIMPAPLGIDNEDDMITGMFEGSKGPLTLNDEEIALCQRHKDLGDRIKELEAQKDAVDIDFKAKLVTRAKPDKAERKLSATGGGFSVSWSFYQKHSVDSEALKKACLFDHYSKITDCDRMTITAKKKGA